MNLLRRLVPLAVLVALLSAAALRAQTVAGAPTTIDYQGKALDAAGAVLAPTTPANYEMQFRIYDAQEGGAIVWSEKQIVTVSKGLFSVRLGEGTVNGSEVRPALSEAFNGSERFLGVTIVITGQTPVEILPRLAFLATPFAYVANRAQSAERLILNPSTSAATSSLNVSQLSFSTQTITGNTTLTDQNHTAIVSAASAAVTITLPGVTTPREYFISKQDSTTNIVTVTPPSGGTINGSTSSLRLKVLGDSIAIQNIGGNNWWVVSDTRDKTPIGTIISHGGTATPAGYVRCDGTLYNRTTTHLTDLFAAIGTAWGAPDASTFRVPDLRGAFLRGVDGGRGFDDDRNSRSVPAPGGNSGDAVGSYEADSFKSHNHTGSVSGSTSSDGNHNHLVGADQTGGWLAGYGQSSDRGRNTTFPTDYAGVHSHTFSGSFTTASTGSSETRPENFAVNYFIKY